MPCKFSAVVFFTLLFLQTDLWARTGIPADSPAMKFFKLGKELSSADQMLNWLFIGVILAGGVLLILASFTDIVWAAPGYRTLFGMYLACWAAYGIWYVDVRFGFPNGLNRFRVLPVFLGVTAGFFLLREFLDFFWKNFKPLEKGMIRCRSCRQVISKLMIECPYCSRRV